MKVNNKKLLGILVLGLLWCNVGFAEDYKNLLKKAKTASKEQIQEIINHISVGYDLEIGIAERCMYDLKSTQEFGQSCEKLVSRFDAVNNLGGVFAVPNFRNKLSEITKALDKGEKLPYINTSEFMRDLKAYTRKLSKFEKLVSDILFLKNNL